MSRRSSIASVNLDNHLDELKRRQKLEGLRETIKAEQCFAVNKNPDTALITIEELKKLVRLWKLHEHRNFWKLHPDVNSIVEAIYSHMADVQKSKAGGDLTPHVPSTPQELENAYFSYRTRASILKEAQQKKRDHVKEVMKEFCGNNQGREVTAQEILLQSRKVAGSKYDECSPQQLVKQFRDDDMEFFDIENSDSMVNDRKSSLTHGVQSALSLRTKKTKHRNLAAHLAKYSASEKSSKTPINHQAVQTFVTVSESDDSQVVTNCLIGLSNISVHHSVRIILIELNAVHKFANMLQIARGNAAILASNLIYYYFSCENEIEDRIYNASFSILHNSGVSPDIKIRMITLYTLNNLLPSVDRVRIVDLIMTIINNHLSSPTAINKTTLGIFLKIFQNICAFCSAQNALLNANVLDILSQISAHASSVNDEELAIPLVKCLCSFLHTTDICISYLNEDYVMIIQDLFLIRNDVILRYLIKICAYMSADSRLIKFISIPSIVTAVANVIENEEKITIDVARDAAKYLNNICLVESDNYLIELVNYGVPEAILDLIKKSFNDLSVQNVAVKGLQNLLSVKDNCIKLAELCYKHLLKMVASNDIGAIMCIFNICCVPECIQSLYEQNIHLKILDNFLYAKKISIRAAYLDVLLILSKYPIFCEELIKNDLIKKIEKSVIAPDSSELWDSCSKIILTLVFEISENLDVSTISTIVNILKIICTDKSSEKVISQCAVTLAYLSINEISFAEIDELVKKIIELTDSDIVMDAISTLLYNVTCSERNASFLLRDAPYLNTMIRMMRTSKPDVQLNTAEGIRSLCSIPKCAELLINEDLLSDLTVIALLRASSMDIKIVCCEAFYNMLCHSGTRLELLKGDFWWGMMRLCRTDCVAIRKICAKVLFDLSFDKESCLALREHKIFYFIKDISVSADIEFLEAIMKPVYNITTHLDSLNHEDVTCLLRLCLDVMNRSKSIQTISTSITIILLCAHENIEIASIECSKFDLPFTLSQSRSLWSTDLESCINISSLLWLLSTSSVFSKTIILADISSLLTDIYLSQPIELIGDNTISIIVQYISYNTNPNTILSIPCFDKLICDILYFPHGNQVQNRPNYSINSKANVLYAYSYVVKSIIASPNTLSINLVSSLLNSSLISNSLTSQNLLHIIDNFSTNSAICQLLHDSNIFGLLAKYLAECRKSSQTQSIIANDFCSNVIKNLSINRKSLLPRMVASHKNGLSKLVGDILEDACSAICCKNLSLFFYNISRINMKDSNSMNPQLVLSLVYKLNEITKDQEIIKVGKVIISTILEKHSEGFQVDPSFVQTMFVEMNEKSNSAYDENDMEIDNTLNGIQLYAYLDGIKQKKPLPIKKIIFNESETKWQPTIIIDKKRMDFVMVEMTNTTKVFSTVVESTDLISLILFEKIIKEYPTIQPDETISRETLTISESNEEDNEKNELEAIIENAIYDDESYGGSSFEQPEIDEPNDDIRQPEVV